MGFEIDVLPVGEGEKSGDAIALRFGNLFGNRNEQYVMVIDGGTKDSGENLIQHVKEFYKTELIDLVVSTHPDQDHSSGLSVVIDKLKVNELWMHCPWNHSTEILDSISDSRVTENSIQERFIKSLDDAKNLYDIATQKKIKIREPFAGLTNNNRVFVLGPTKEYYESLLPSFRPIGQSQVKTLVEYLIKANKDKTQFILEDNFTETLDNEDGTRPENNSSVILFINLPKQKILLTGDAGITALTNSIDYANLANINISGLDFFQVPHHGSKRNLGPTILKKLIGPINNGNKVVTSVISASIEGEPKHPSKRVVNALIRRGAEVFTTQGKAVLHRDDSPQRNGWVNAVPLDFTANFEE